MDTVSVGAVTADGVLSITLARKPEAKPKQIEVKVASAPAVETPKQVEAKA